MLDVAIIGAGVSGCAVARELARYNLKIGVFEKTFDIAGGTSKANSAIVHAGYDAQPGTLKAKFNALGRDMFPALSKELDFPFVNNGSLVVCFSSEEEKRLWSMTEKGRQNGVAGLEILDRKKTLELEPNLSDRVYSSLYAPDAGVTCPYEMTVALAENAFNNGVDFRLGAEVVGIARCGKGYRLDFKDGGAAQTRAIVNAAGLYADEINNMVSARKLKIIPRKGEYCLFDKTAGGLINRTVFQLPTSMGKGVLVTRTADGNLLAGPNAVDVEDKTDTDTTADGLAYVLSTAGKSLRGLPTRQIITSFAGLRAHLCSDDFLIGESADAENFFNVAGIESPGLSCAPAIGKTVAEMVREKLSAEPNPSFDPVRRSFPKFRNMSEEERQRAVAKDPAYGRIICRCETVTEAEIIDAVRRPLGAKTLDGIKLRTRAGMGRCQSGFCTPRLIEILSRELGVPFTSVTKSGPGSELLVGLNKMIGGKAE